MLADHLERAAAGEPGLILIGGPARSGRSTLLATFARDIAWKQRRTRALLVRRPGTGRYDPVAQAARDLEGRIARSMGRTPGTAVRLLPDWVGTLPGVGNILAAVVATISVVRRNRVRVTGVSDDVRRVLRSARGRVVVLLIDDLHHGDGAAFQKVQALMERASPGHRLLVIATHHADDEVRVERLRAAAGEDRALRLHMAKIPTVHSIDLSVFGAELLAVLRAASALGESFDSLTLSRALRRDELDIEDVLSVAVRKGVAVIDGEIELRDGETATQYRFTSDSMRHALDEVALPRDIAV